MGVIDPIEILFWIIAFVYVYNAPQWFLLGEIETYT